MIRANMSTSGMIPELEVKQGIPTSGQTVSISKSVTAGRYVLTVADTGASDPISITSSTLDGVAITANQIGSGTTNQIVSYYFDVATAGTLAITAQGGSYPGAILIKIA